MARIREVAIILNAYAGYDRKLLQGVAAYARRAGNWSLYVEEDPLQKLPNFPAWRGDGIISDFDDRRVAMALRKVRVPVVGIGGGYGWYDPRSLIPYVNTDNVGISRLAAEHLLDRGFTRFAYCGYPRTRVNGWVRERARAFAGRIAEAGFTCSVFTGRHSTARQWADIQRELSVWLESLAKPVGLMACYDVRARHVLEACRRLGLNVPDDVAVIGVDNDEMLCELTRPSLTSVAQGTQHIGYKAASILDRLMSGRRIARRRYMIGPEGVVVRQSTDTVAVEDPDVAAAVRFIRQHACEGIRLQDVLDAVHLSCSALAKRFRNTLGRTIHMEIQRAQIEYAKRLLTSTDMPVKQVARRCGFKYVEYMTTVFRRATAQTPGEYRKARLGYRM